MMRAAFFWALTWLHFFLACPLLVGAGIIFGHKRVDPILRWFCQNIARCAGARLAVSGLAKLDGLPACFYVVNHVNLFDPFFLCAKLPPVTRGVELESHFKIPVYGWLATRFGNVPVPDVLSPAALKTTYRRAAESLTSGTSLIMFPEGTRTRTGELGPFQEGAFRMARKLKVPLVPVTLKGMFELHPTGTRRLARSTVTVVIHDPIHAADLSPAEFRGLKNRVHEIMARAL